MKKGQVLGLVFSLISITYSGNSFAYLIEWQTSEVNSSLSTANNVSFFTNNTSITSGNSSGATSANLSSAEGYAKAESSFVTSTTGFDLFAEAEVGVNDDGWFNANSNSNFSGSFIIRGDSFEAVSSSVSLTVNINSFVETNTPYSDPTFEINGNTLGFDPLLSLNTLTFNFTTDFEYSISAYEYTVISQYFTATSPASVYNRQGEMNVLFDFGNPVTSVPAPGTTVLFILGLMLLWKKILFRAAGSR